MAISYFLLAAAIPRRWRVQRERERELLKIAATLGAVDSIDNKMHIFHSICTVMEQKEKKKKKTKLPSTED